MNRLISWSLYILAVFGLLIGSTALLASTAHAEVLDGIEYGDLSIVHKVIIAEAGGEGFNGMLAVANVIRNRARVRNMSFEAVVRQKWQFSCLNGGEANLDTFIRKNRGVWRDALDAWQVSESEDITGGADHYHTKSVNPSWNRGMVQTVIIGNHRFFKNK